MTCLQFAYNNLYKLVLLVFVIYVSCIGYGLWYAVQHHVISIGASVGIGIGGVIFFTCVIPFRTEDTNTCVLGSGAFISGIV